MHHERSRMGQQVPPTPKYIGLGVLNYPNLIRIKCSSEAHPNSLVALGIFNLEKLTTFVLYYYLSNRLYRNNFLFSLFQNVMNRYLMQGVSNCSGDETLLQGCLLLTIKVTKWRLLENSDMQAMRARFDILILGPVHVL